MQPTMRKWQLEMNVCAAVLSLLYVPVVFTYVDDAKRWVKLMASVGQAAKQAKKSH